eukprot:TRINITY_DN2713_c0_g1_i1.p1 TRINITY_DN2713_c0_g1~~TRINITY_DN2713_c0_g1_i1.p1  ORF type:complete len:637 (+),score=144.23 TRINITY_DN2713_c0_g1_i1:59-1912(+)
MLLAATEGEGTLRQQKQQVLTNEMLLSDVESHEDRVERQHAKMHEVCCAQQMELQTWHLEANKSLESQQERTKWAALPDITAEDIIQSYGMKTSVHDVAKLSAKFSGEKGTEGYYYENLEKMLERLKAGKLHGTQESLAHLKEPPGKNGADNCTLINGFVELYGLSRTKPVEISEILVLLNKSESTIKDLRKRFDQLDVQHTQALHEREDMGAAEILHNQLDDVLEEIVSLRLARLSLLLDSAQGEKTIGAVSEITNDLTNLIENARHFKEDWTEQITNDLDALENGMRKNLQTQQDEGLLMQRLYGKCKTNLIDNTQKQGKIFENIKKMYEDLQALGEERRGLVDDLLHEKSQHEERVAATVQTNNVCQQHKTSLEKILTGLETIDSPLNLLELFMSETREKTILATNQAKLETEHILLKERRAHFAEYYDYYLLLGELLFAKESRLQEICDQRDVFDHLINMTKTTLDPKKVYYQEQLRELTHIKQALEIDIDTIRQRADQAVEDATPTEEALLESGDKIVSPVIELQERNSERQRDIIAMRKQLLDSKKRSVDIQEEDSTTKVKMAKHARITGLGSHMLPLSPDGLRPKNCPTPEERRRTYAEKLRKTISENER